MRFRGEISATQWQDIDMRTSIECGEIRTFRHCIYMVPCMVKSVTKRVWMSLFERCVQNTEQLGGSWCTKTLAALHGVHTVVFPMFCYRFFFQGTGHNICFASILAGGDSHTRMHTFLALRWINYSDETGGQAGNYRMPFGERLRRGQCALQYA